MKNTKEQFYTIKKYDFIQILLLGNEKGLNKLFFLDLDYDFKIDSLWIQKDNYFKKTIKQIDEYFLGQRKSFDITFNLEGNEFQNSVWNSLLKIKYGTTQNYKDVAIAVGKPKAYRAVGTAIGKNPLPILIPCHRVISSTGLIGGYTGGIKFKKKFLIIENIDLN